MKRLTSKFVATAPPGKHHDGDAGLYLLVAERNGRISKSFVQRIAVRGKRVEIGLGSAKHTTPSQARAKAAANHKIALGGGDPRRQPVAVPTFACAMEKVIANHEAGWKDGGKSAKQWHASLRDYALPRLGRMPVDRIASADVFDVLMADGLWHSKHETARRVRQRIGAVMKWAIVQGHRPDNPAGEALGAALPKHGGKRQHFRALPYDQVGDAVQRVRASRRAYPTTKLAFEFMTLTAARSGEVRGATWTEIALDAAVWTVPASRMKAKTEHRVPLSGRAVEVLQDAAPYRDRSGLVFPSVRGLEMSDSTISKLVKELGIDGTPHGMRSAFRDWASEQTDAPHAVMEAALAHVIPNKAEAAYARSDLFEKRRRLLDQWAAYISTKHEEVVALQRAD